MAWRQCELQRMWESLRVTLVIVKDGAQGEIFLLERHFTRMRLAEINWCCAREALWMMAGAARCCFCGGSAQRVRVHNRLGGENVRTGPGWKGGSSAMFCIWCSCEGCKEGIIAL